MTPEMVVDVGRQTLTVIVMLSAPMLVTALVIGVAVGMIQAATSIQEMTLTFIPKLMGIFAALIITGHWMINLLVNFTLRLYESIPSMIG